MTTQEEDAFDLARVQLNKTQDWCYHEGSYGHNPEYGATHILTLGSNNTAHTTTDYDDGANVNKSAAKGAITFWRISTRGECYVPKEVSPTGDIGHTHSVSKRGDTLTVTVNYGKTGEKKTERLSVAGLYRQFVARGETVRYEL